MDNKHLTDKFFEETRLSSKQASKQASKQDYVLYGDCRETLKTLPDCIVDCCVTSPPYYALRDYGEDQQIGLEDTPEEYIKQLVDVFRECRRVLKDDGTLWLNIGDSYANSNGFARASEQFQRQGRNNAPANDRNLSFLHEAGYKTKDLIGVPWMLAFALRADGWYLRQDIIWHKPNPMPESVRDRCTKSHEYIFLLSKQAKYYFDNEAIQEVATGYDGRKDTMNKGSTKYADSKYIPVSGTQTMAAKGHERWRWKNLQDKGQQTHSMHERRADGLPDEVYPVRNKRDVWTIPAAPLKIAHFATFPEKLIEPCILAGSRKGGIVLDPFFGSGTTGRVAIKHGRHYIGCELNKDYIEISEQRTGNIQMELTAYL